MLFPAPPPAAGDEGVRLRSRTRAFSAFIILALLALTLLTTNEEMLEERSTAKPPNNPIQDPRVVRIYEARHTFFLSMPSRNPVMCSARI